MLIIGATGRSGLAIIRELRSRDSGHEIHTLVRSADRLPDDVRSACIVAEGSVLSPDTMKHALDPSPDMIVIAVGNSVLLRAQSIREDITKSVLDAMEATNCQAKVVVVSALGASGSLAQFSVPFRYVISFLLYHPLNDHTRQEAMIKDRLQPDQWLVLRPTQLSENEGTKKYTVTTDGHVRTWRIPRADVAHFAVDQMEGIGETMFGNFVAISS